MCGINGFVSKQNSRDIETINKMNDIIIHRGPDDDGIYFENYNNYSVGMGMRRLSIIDKDNGNQPMYSDDKTKAVVFNGEIYNFQSLKIELSQKGVLFKTDSDTEVILKLYEKEGLDSFSRLDGMFAFAIFDKKLNKVFIVRDFFGEKPLYYTKNGNELIWASELKSIVTIFEEKPKISKQGLNLFFKLTYIPAPFSIYENILKLEANHYLEFDCESFSVSIQEIKQNFSKYHSLSKKSAKTKTKELVYNSVLSRSISDVPLGSFLSGGVDSSIISLCLSQSKSTPIDTFSIGFDKQSFDETSKSRLVSKLIGSNHHEFKVSGKDLSENIHEIILNFDEPFADSSALASYLVANKAKQSVTVSLTGDGGDEVFGGYNKYYIGFLNKKYTSILPEKAHNLLSNSLKSALTLNTDSRGLKYKLKRFFDVVDYNDDFYYNIISLGFQDRELNSLLKNDWIKSDSFKFFKDLVPESKSLTDFRNIDKIISLEGDMLVKVDRTSMLNSIECRSPFLNKEIWNFTSQLPEDFLINKSDKKHILKESFDEYFPKNFLDKSKKGFNVPVGDWLREDLVKELLSFIEKDFLSEQQIFNYETIIQLVNNHISGKIDSTFKVWTFYCFQKWYKNIYEA